MASLMEELLDTLEKEHEQYVLLLELSERKTDIIVKRDITALEQITDEEQIVVNRISHLDTKRETVTNDIANVINKDVESLKLTKLIELLAGQPKEQKRLIDIQEKLKVTVGNVRKINEHNQSLIAQSLEMIEFDMNMMQAMTQAPQTANYGRNAINVGETLGRIGGFDAKQ